MKLMFWKKKTGAEEEAEETPAHLAVNTKPQEPLDFSAAQTETIEHAPDESGSEPAANSGLVARMKSRLNAMLSRFRRPPPFRAEGGSTTEKSDEPDVPDEPEIADAASEIEAEPEASELDVSTKPSLSVRIKLGVIAFTRRFRKPSTSGGDESEEHTEEDEGAHEPAASPRHGFFERFKAACTAFMREFSASPRTAASQEEDEEKPHGRTDATPGEALSESEQAIQPVRSRKWVVIGGSIVIVLLLLFSVVLANWPIFEEKPKRWGTKHNITSISSRPNRMEDDAGSLQTSIPPETQAEIEALRQQNAELQARIEAQQHATPSRQSYAPAGTQGWESPAATTAASGELVVDSKDPKATAMTLKEAIEAMNASTGDYAKKPGK